MADTVANNFMTAANAVGLRGAALDLAWDRARKLGLSPDDPMTIYLVTGGLLEAAAKKIPAAIDALPGCVEKAAKKAVGQVATAAAAKVRRDLTDLGVKIGERVGVSVTNTIDEAMDSRRNAMRLHVGANLLAVFALVALLAGGVGYWIGRSNLAAIEQQWQALAGRADASTWFSLAASNSDLAATLRSFCGPGSPLAFIQGGSRACKVPLWIDAPAAPAVAGTVAGVYSSVLDWLNRWSPLVLVGVGLLAGLLLRRGSNLSSRPAPSPGSSISEGPRSKVLDRISFRMARLTGALNTPAFALPTMPISKMGRKIPVVSLVMTSLGRLPK